MIDVINNLINNHTISFIIITIAILFFVTVIIRGWPDNTSDDEDNDEEDDEEIASKYRITVSNTDEANKLLHQLNELIVSVEKFKNE